jgi:TonB family protein
MSRTLRSLLAFTALALLTLGAAPAAEPTADKAAAETLAQAWKLLEGRQFREAARAFEKADELMGGKCGACQVGLSRAQHAAGNRKAAIAAARRATAVLTRPDSLAQAWNQLGVALISDKKKDLEEAEAAFRKAVELSGGGGLARYNLAELLLRAERHTEALEAARAYMRTEPQGFAAQSARIVLCQAKRITDPPILDPRNLPEGTFCTPDELRLPDEPDQEAMKADAARVSRPQKIHGEPPFYSEQARQDRAQGVVLLESIIDEEGCVRNLRVCRSLHPDLDKISSETLARWVFEPARLDGKEVKVYYTLTVNFTFGPKGS